MVHQEWDPKAYRDNAAFVPSFGKSVVALLDPKPGERILDLGCGDGTLTAKIADTTPLVIGVDSSPEMVYATRERGLAAIVMRGEALQFDTPFDAVFSNAALHWMHPPSRVLSGVRRALVPGGRFVAELGGCGNIARIIAAIETVTTEHPEFGSFQNPWYFPCTSEYRDLLEHAGFSVDYIESYERPTPLESGMRSWLDLFATRSITGLTPQDRHRFLDRCEELLRQELYDPEAGWWADYVRLRFRAVTA